MSNTMSHRRFRIGATLLLISMIHGGYALGAAADYPVKPLRFIVPFPPSGAPDVMVRTISAGLEKAWGQQVIVDNRAGANGIIATEVTAKAPKDGYTVMFGSNATLTINAALHSKLPFDPLKDFTAITQIAYAPLIIVANPGAKVSNMKELIAVAKAQPGKLRYGTSGIGSTGHLAIELLKLSTSTDITHVPYKGIAMATMELLGGQIDLTIGNILNVAGHMKTGQLIPISVTSAKRTPALPNVPAVSETIPGYEVIIWWGVFGPAGIPQPIVTRLEKEIGRILSDTQLKDRWANDGFIITPSTSQQLDSLMKNEYKNWGQVVRKAGIKAE